VEVSDKALGPNRRNAWHLAAVLEVSKKLRMDQEKL
jgi:hypothetical protein